MQPISFQCPLCHASLKVRDRALIGRHVPCPECGESLQIAMNGAHVSVLPDEVKQESAPSPEDPPTTDEQPVSAEVLQHTVWWRQPRNIAWTATTICVIVFAALLWPQNSTVQFPQNKNADALVDETRSEPTEEKQPQPGDVVTENGDAKKQLWNQPTGDVQQQLKRLGKLLQQQAAHDGHFPRGTIGDGPAVERFSWPAKLAAGFASGDIPAPVWERGWQDPVNGRFIRRRLPVFLNPGIKELAGEDGLPTTHFVGMAGVGADAAQLPVEHARAGIFGEDRETKTTDVKDGLAHTILIAGVRSRLGGWTVGGSATVRPFVQEPYVNGPDGFGTGQKDGMWVLMADGSVVFRSIKTDPALLRSEAAMSDEFYRRNPPPVFAEKDPPAQPPTEQTAAESPPTVEDPISDLVELVIEATKEKQEAKPEEAPPAVLTRAEIQVRLDRRIARYKLSDEAKFGVVFLELEEMVAVPLEYDAEKLQGAAEVWNHPLQLDLKNVTVGELLEKVLQPVGLSPEIADGKIVIQEAKPGGRSSR